MESGKSETVSAVWQIAVVNIRHNLKGTVLAALGITGLIPVFFSMTNLTENACAIPLEMMFSLVGIVLLTPVFYPEEKKQIAQVVETRYYGPCLVETIRTCDTLLALVLLSAGFFLYMKGKGCEVTLALFVGTLADAVFLGSLGYAAAAFTGNTIISYMVPIMFYMMNFFGKEKLGKFYLFAMMNGEHGPDRWLMAGGLGMIVAALGIRSKIFRKRIFY